MSALEGKGRIETTAPTRTRSATQRANTRV
jgi:hypothetical protein